MILTIELNIFMIILILILYYYTNTILCLGTKRVVGEWGQEGLKGGGGKYI